jgi:threonine dehydrogenase-like Zn-dependent dehydrogenase
MGHEFIGTVEAIGSEVAMLNVGDLVVSPFLCSRAPASSAKRDCRASASPT